MSIRKKIDVLIVRWFYDFKIMPGGGYKYWICVKSPRGDWSRIAGEQYVSKAVATTRMNDLKKNGGVWIRRAYRRITL